MAFAIGVIAIIGLGTLGFISMKMNKKQPLNKIEEDENRELEKERILQSKNNIPWS